MYWPVKARSVPAWRRTRYCLGVRRLAPFLVGVGDLGGLGGGHGGGFLVLGLVGVVGGNGAGWVGGESRADREKMRLGGSSWKC